MIDFDTLSNYKALRPYKDYLIYYEYEEEQGTWSVWSTTEYDSENEPDPSRVYGGGDRPLLVRAEVLGSGFYSSRAEGTSAAKAFIEELEVSYSMDAFTVAA